MTLQELQQTVQQMDHSNLPQHVAVIMDGNGRWAQQRQHERIYGHQNAITAVRQTIETAVALKIPYLTLYTFSTENWSRPFDEVDGLMALLAQALVEQIDVLMKNNVRLLIIGDIQRLPVSARQHLDDAMNTTSRNGGTTLILALSYSAQWEIVESVRKIARQVANGTLSPDAIDGSVFANNLCTAGISDPDLLIRTGGEQRLSNFLLWQMAYTELYFTPLLWPDFRHEDFLKAVADYQQRQRRFGKSGDQVEEEQQKTQKQAK